jgi:Sec-independent protein translocase protein TatA
MRFSNCIGLGIAPIFVIIVTVFAPSAAQNAVAQNADGLGGFRRRLGHGNSEIGGEVYRKPGRLWFAHV